MLKFIFNIDVGIRDDINDNNIVNDIAINVDIVFAAAANGNGYNVAHVNVVNVLPM